MVMNDAASILVIILGIFLAVFLLLAIILVVLLIRVSKKINAITDAVQSTTEKVETVVAGLSKVTSPILLAKIIMKQFKETGKRKGSKHE